MAKSTPVSGRSEDRKLCKRCGREMPNRTAHERRKVYCCKMCANQGPHKKTVRDLRRGKKVCNGCGRDLGLEEYSLAGHRADGTPIYRSRCKSCRCEKSKTDHLANRQEDLAKMRLYQITNGDKISQRKRKQYLENRDRILKASRARYRQNPERQRRYNRRYYARNKKRLLQDNREWRRQNRQWTRDYSNMYVRRRYETDPAYKVMRNIGRTLNHWARGIKRGMPAHTVLGYGPNELLARLNEGDYTIQDYMRGGHAIDHIIPKNLYEPDEIEKCWALRNLRIIPWLENCGRPTTVDWDLVEEYDIYDLLPRAVGESRVGESGQIS